MSRTLTFTTRRKRKGRRRGRRGELSRRRRKGMKRGWRRRRSRSE